MCNNPNCYSCSNTTHCYAEFTSNDIIQERQIRYYRVFDVNGCEKVVPRIDFLAGLQIKDCGGIGRSPSYGFASCIELNSAISALRLRGCNSELLPLNTPIVECSKFTQYFVNAWISSQCLLGNDIQAGLISNVVGINSAGCLVKSPFLGKDCSNAAIDLQNTQIATCVNLANGLSSLRTDLIAVINALTLRDCNNQPIPLTTPIVECSKFAEYFRNRFQADRCLLSSYLPNALRVNAFVTVDAGGCLTQGGVATSLNLSGNGTFNSPLDIAFNQTTQADLCDLGNTIQTGAAIQWLALNASGCIVKASLPIDIQVTNATISGTVLSIIENNGEVNSVDLLSILASSTNVLASNVNTMTSTVNGVASNAPIVNSNDINLVNRILSSTVNGVTDTIDLTSLISACELGFQIGAGTAVQLIGKNSANCLVNAVLNFSTDFTGNGVTTPLEINWQTAVDAQALCDIFDGIATGIPTTLVGRNAVGCPVSQPIRLAGACESPTYVYTEDSAGSLVKKPYTDFAHNTLFAKSLLAQTPNIINTRAWALDETEVTPIASLVVTNPSSCNYMAYTARFYFYVSAGVNKIEATKGSTVEFMSLPEIDGGGGSFIDYRFGFSLGTGTLFAQAVAKDAFSPTFSVQVANVGSDFLEFTNFLAPSETRTFRSRATLVCLDGDSNSVGGAVTQIGFAGHLVG
jgi:hypothetical protein